MTASLLPKNRFSNVASHRLHRRNVLICMTLAATWRICGPEPRSVLAAAGSDEDILGSVVVRRPDAGHFSLQVVAANTNGTVHVVVLKTGSSAPEAKHIIEGTDGRGHAAVWHGAIRVAAVDSFLPGPTSLRAGSSYVAYAVHRSDQLDNSNIVSVQFET